MKVQSTVMPEYIMMKKGKKLVSFDVVESVGDDGVTTYTYEQLHLPETCNDEQVVNAVDARRRELKVNVITPRQCKLQLLTLGLLDEVEAIIATDRALKIWFDESLDFQRSNALIIAVALQLGMSEEDMDTFFIEGAKL